MSLNRQQAGTRYCKGGPRQGRVRFILETLRGLLKNSEQETDPVKFACEKDYPGSCVEDTEKQGFTSRELFEQQ